MCAQSMCRRQEDRVVGEGEQLQASDKHLRLCRRTRLLLPRTTERCWRVRQRYWHCCVCHLLLARASLLPTHKGYRARCTQGGAATSLPVVLFLREWPELGPFRHWRGIWRRPPGRTHSRIAIPGIFWWWRRLSAENRRSLTRKLKSIWKLVISLICRENLFISNRLK